MTKPGDSQTKKTIHELSKEFPEKTYRELEKLSKSQLESTEGEEQDNPTLWDIAKEHKLRQEAEGELSIIKTTSVTNSPEMRAANEEINTLKNKIADLEEALKSKDYFKDPDYKYLIDENRRLEQERNELIVDNKRLAGQVEDKLNQLRKSGM